MTRVSQGRSQPPRASSRSTSNAVNPQISIEPMWNAGPVRPLGCRNVPRLRGSARSATGIRSTAATSPMSVGRTAQGSRHQASTGTTRNSLRVIRQRAEHVNPAGVEAGLLGGLAQRGRHRPVVRVLDRAAGEGGLP
jgi:hypothetical protein